MSPPAPVPASAPPAPLRSALRLLLPLAGVAALLLLVLAGAGLGLRWVATTESGSRWLLRQLPGVQARGFSGALLGPAWQVQQLSVTWGGGRGRVVIDDLHVTGLRWRIAPEAQAWFGLMLDSLAARRASVTLPAAAPGSAATLPADLAPPLRLQVAQAQLDTLVLDGGAPVTALRLQGLLLTPRRGAAHAVRQLAFVTHGVQAEGALSLGNRAPLALQARLSLRPLRDGDRPRWGAALQAQGPLARMTLSGTLRGAPRPDHPAPVLDLQAVLQPGLPWPLASLRLATDQLDLAALADGLPRTRLAGSATLSGGAPGQPLRASATLRNAEPGRWNEGRLPVQQLTLQAERTAAQPDRLRLPQFDIALADTGAAAGRWHGSADWRGATLTLQTRLDGVAPQRLDGRAAAMSLSGPAELVLQGLPAPDGSVAAAALSAQARLDLSGRIEGSPQAVHLQLDARADADRVQLRRLQAQTGGASADLKAELERVGPQGWRLQSSGQVQRFDPLPWWPGAAGSAWRQGPHRLSGDWQFAFGLPADALALPPLALLQRLAGNGRLRVHDSVLAGVPVAADVRVSDDARRGAARGQVDASLEAGGNRLQLQGRGNPGGSGREDHWEARIRAGQLATLAPLARLVPALAGWLPHGGALEGLLSADGRWPVLHTEGQLTLSQLRLGPLGVAQGKAAWALQTGASRPLALQLDLAGLQWDARRADHLHVALRGTLAQHHLEISGAVPMLPPAMAVQVLGVEAQSGTQAQLQADGAWVPDPAGGGHWQARIEHLVVGSWDGSEGDAPPASGWIEARNLGALLQFGPGGRLLALQAEPGRLQLADAASLRWDAVSLDLRGAQPRGELHAAVEPFALAPLLARAQPTVGWQGDLRLAAQVDIRAGDRFDADLAFERRGGDLQIADSDGVQPLGLTDLTLRLTAHDGLWKLMQTFRGSHLGEINTQVQAQTGPEREWPDAHAPLQGSLQARVADLGIWSGWVPPGWRLTGELRTAATIGGRFGQPQYTGEVDGSGIGLRNLLQGVNLRDGRLALRLQGDTARIETFTLRGGDGQATLSGGATLGAAPHASLQLKAEHFRVLGRVDRQAVLSGSADLELGVDDLRLTGRFGIDEGLYDTSRADAPSLDDDVTVLRPGRTPAPGPEAAAARPQRKVAMDLTIDLGRNMHVLGRGLDTQLRGEVRLTTPGGRLAVNGTVRTEGGTYAAYGQNLDIERGVIAFSGVADNPRLDVLALRPNLDVQVGVQISGNLQTPRVRLYSNPDMADGDKLSWLLLGRPPDNLGRNDTALLQQAAVALLSGEGRSPTDALLHNLGIDQLSLRQSDGSTPGTVPGTVVSLGKQITRNWYLGYERGVNATSGTWQLVYRLAQRFTLRLQGGLDN
ncbi:MAG: translocation/assembly module TamB domain-containing protein, partial [Burkholderiales bacterium]|nr:translocation/assembly module TamB domain-containing protein [Burkholderiales bacterium]